jgi:hypothetical protein
MTLRGWAAASVALSLLALSGCDGGDDGSEPAPEGSGGAGGDGQQIAGDADPSDVRVIDAWSDALRSGDVEGAAGYFAIPSVAENGPLLRLRDRHDVRLFNASLPCGAVLVRAESQGDFTTATFRLTERPGPGACGPGTGQDAQTAFVIEEGRIAEWRRVAVGGAEPAPGEAI